MGRREASAAKAADAKRRAKAAVVAKATAAARRQPKRAASAVATARISSRAASSDEEGDESSDSDGDDSSGDEAAVATTRPAIHFSAPEGAGPASESSAGASTARVPRTYESAAAAVAAPTLSAMFAQPRPKAEASSSVSTARAAAPKTKHAGATHAPAAEPPYYAQVPSRDRLERAAFSVSTDALVTEEDAVLLWIADAPLPATGKHRVGFGQLDNGRRIVTFNTRRTYEPDPTDPAVLWPRAPLAPKGRTTAMKESLFLDKGTGDWLRKTGVRFKTISESNGNYTIQFR